MQNDKMRWLLLLLFLVAAISHDSDAQTRQERSSGISGGANKFDKLKVDTNYRFTSMDSVGAYFSERLKELKRLNVTGGGIDVDSVYQDYGFKLNLCRVKYLESNAKEMRNFRHLLYLTQDMRLGQARLQGLFDAYPEAIRKSSLGEQVLRNLHRMENTVDKSKIAQLLAYEFKSVKGSAFKIGETRKPYILIDFWASWCGPCIVENRELRELYDAMDTSLLCVVGVSLDVNAGKWKNAIAREGYRWTNVADLKGWESPIAKLLPINGIPLKLLVDKDFNLLKYNPDIPYLKKKFTK